MNEHWITVKEAAMCSKRKENTIVQQVNRGTLQYKYIAGKGRGGKQLRILLESLSPEAQRNYLKEQKKTTSGDAEKILLSRLSADQRDRLEEKLLITRKYIEFRDNYPHKDHVKQFVKYMKKHYPTFTGMADKANEIAVNGVIAKVDNTAFIVTPSSYFPSQDIDFILVHPCATLGPVKLAEYKIHDKPQGISGWLCEGRIYYDAFVLNNKKNAIVVSKKQSTV